MNDGVPDVDPACHDAACGEIDSNPLSGARDHAPLCKLAAAWGLAAMHAHRYYVIGKDVWR